MVVNIFRAGPGSITIIQRRTACMKNLFQQEAVQEIQGRIARITAANERQWGKMGPAQALAHCSRTMEWAVGDVHPKRAFLGRIFGPMAKSRFVDKDIPIGRNSPTDKTLIIKEDCDMAVEKQRLSGLLDRFAAGGPAGCTTHPHSFFGKLTPEEWAVLAYKHTDHHLRQFGA